MGEVMRSWWVSWYLPHGLAFTLDSPWWFSGQRMSDDALTVCAAVRATDHYAAWRMIEDAYDAPPEEIEMRFCELRPDDWSPFCDRFPRADWMQWSVAEAAR